MREGRSPGKSQKQWQEKKNIKRKYKNKIKKETPIHPPAPLFQNFLGCRQPEPDRMRTFVDFSYPHDYVLFPRDILIWRWSSDWGGDRQKGCKREGERGGDRLLDGAHLPRLPYCLWKHWINRYYKQTNRKFQNLPFSSSLIFSGSWGAAVTSTGCISSINGRFRVFIKWRSCAARWRRLWEGWKECWWRRDEPQKLARRLLYTLWASGNSLRAVL